jgi:type III pantothenate kinase
MVLTIDIGNTSAKVAVFQDNEIIFSERVATDWHTEIGKLCATYDIKGCGVSNVAGPNEALDRALQLLPCPVLRLTYTSPCAQPYFQQIPQGLGADRLAADIAAVTQMPNTPVLVIDAGTCLTFDVIDENHCFAGGNISPGVELRLKAMHEHTAALPLISVEGDLPDLGYDTATAIRGEQSTVSSLKSKATSACVASVSPTSMCSTQAVTTLNFHPTSLPALRTTRTSYSADSTN